MACELVRSQTAAPAAKADPFRSAMSMLVFFLNRAGRGISAKRRRVLDSAKDEFRALYGRKRKTWRDLT